MLYYENNKWHISTLKVEYMQDRETLENYIGAEGKRWWNELAGLHENIEIVKFIDLNITNEQLARLEEINQLNIGDGYSEVVGMYVMRDIFPDEASHILKDLENKKANIKQGIELSEREINEIMIAMQVSDIEIDILELKLGGI